MALVIIASINIPWPTFGQEVQDGKLTEFKGQPDIIEVDDLKGDKMVIEANGGSVFVSIFNSLTNQEAPSASNNRKNHQQ